MAKFKIGDRVSFTGNEGQPLSGSIAESGPDDGDLNYVMIDVDKGCGYHVASVIRYYGVGDPREQVTLIESAPNTPKPKTIPARNLSGKHIGRVVTITTKSGAVVTDELSMVGHSEDGVTAILKSVSPEGSFVRGQGFDIDPNSEVIVK